MEAQLKIRQEAQEKQNVLADLLRWQPEANKRAGSDANAKQSAGPSVPGRQAGLAPLRNQRGNAPSKQSVAPVAPNHIRESANGAAKVDATAGNHTYDYFREWDKFDYDAALADVDGEQAVRQAPAGQAELQHQMNNQR